LFYSEKMLFFFPTPLPPPPPHPLPPPPPPPPPSLINAHSGKNQSEARILNASLAEPTLTGSLYSL